GREVSERAVADSGVRSITGGGAARFGYAGWSSGRSRSCDDLGRKQTDPRARECRLFRMPARLADGFGPKDLPWAPRRRRSPHQLGPPPSAVAEARLLYSLLERSTVQQPLALRTFDRLPGFDSTRRGQRKAPHPVRMGAFRCPGRWSERLAQAAWRDRA